MRFRYHLLNHHRHQQTRGKAEYTELRRYGGLAQSPKPYGGTDENRQDTGSCQAETSPGEKALVM